MVLQDAAKQSSCISSHRFSIEAQSAVRYPTSPWKEMRQTLPPTSRPAAYGVMLSPSPLPAPPGTVRGWPGDV